jgi:DNA invertase Pin-like site-specific DNA recombinase
MRLARVTHHSMTRENLGWAALAHRGSVGGLVAPIENPLERHNAQVCANRPLHRIVAQSHYFIGLSQAEIAKRYDVTEDAIKKRLQFIRAWLNVQARATL